MTERLVDIQVVLPDEAAAMRPAELIDLGVAAEALGYHTVWLPDHLLPPDDYGNVFGGVYEPLITLSYLAARTTTIRLATSVLVLPMRNPFVVAKQVATLDRLSEGRMNLGVGVGWNRTEFDAVGADFRTRGARTDEAIALLRHLFGGGRGPFPGKFYGYETGVFEPKPTRHVPITVGGTSDRALQRAAALADEWQGVNLAPEQFARCLVRLGELGERQIRVGTRIECADESQLGETVEQTRAFAEAGADAVAIRFGAVEGFAARMTEFAERWSAKGR
ncbi:TIGR03619 family F420-dependent LLM class oxidoreductase [Saccharopolyspora sp. NPDC050389]|uniref:TIGR03619 family F420-dependent LLM class oxidoreductase n=1 Tax=Saccharopolyspora sp. NPDC050389 TaxID=3155516 RepID=UPI0033E85D34